jgi:hypothetical protein
MRGMQHAVAVEGVVHAVGLEPGIGAIAQVDAVQVGRDLAFDLEFVKHVFLENGGEGPGQHRPVRLAERRLRVKG